MPSQRHEKELVELETRVQPQLDATIAHNVIRALGQPVDLHRVQVHTLWPEHYRVNVFLGADATSSTVGHSYFVVTDNKGGIIASTPEIKRHYQMESQPLA